VPRGHGARVLFDDDEELLAQMGHDTLTALGYEVEGGDIARRATRTGDR
jgi:hypothetical protein